MKQTHLIAALVGIIAIGIVAADASAYYHPTMGRFLSRDPGAGSAKRVGTGGPAVAGGFIPMDQYADGMNLYQYVGSNPTNYIDPTGLWKSSGHVFLTHASYVRFGEWRGQQRADGHIATPAPTPSCSGYILATLRKANLSQDSGQAFKENFRHYNRDLNEDVAGAKTKFQNYVAKEIRFFDLQLGKVDGKCNTKAEKTACNNALWSLGRVTHTWQDYYAHAVLASNGKAGPAWAANPSITGSPDNDNDQLKPSSWGSIAKPGEHGWSEPASRDKPGGEQKRKNDAENFVFDKYKTHLSNWYSKCWCCCPAI